VTGALAIWGAVVGAVVVAALALPCNGCRLRRERLKRAYRDWKKARL
jgi:gas vesicle protein